MCGHVVTVTSTEQMAQGMGLSARCHSASVYNRKGTEVPEQTQPVEATGQIIRHAERKRDNGAPHFPNEYAQDPVDLSDLLDFSGLQALVSCCRWLRLNCPNPQRRARESTRIGRQTGCQKQVGRIPPLHTSPPRSTARKRLTQHRRAPNPP